MFEADPQRTASTEKTAVAPGRGARVLLVVAHPDDETTGAGARLPLFAESSIVLVTDGAPRAGHDASNAGCATWRDYATLRRRELEQALGYAGVSPSRVVSLDYPDQGASWAMAEAAQRVAELVASFRPHLLLTHPYEGGHPDHDATAFIAHAACALWRAGAAPPLELPPIVEMASYHGARADGVTTFQEFIHHPARPVTTLALDPEERSLKRRMLDAHASQARTLASFRDDVERYRVAPLYDFTQPPHPGRLNYERFDWGMSGERWRTLAQRALTALAALAAPAPSRSTGSRRLQGAGAPNGSCWADQTDRHPVGKGS